ncbi:MAG: von Willebrand factor type A domain-containing protein [Ferruginibacter sp.]
MKKLTAYCLFFFIATTAHSQFYLRGSIRDEKNEGIENVRVLLRSSKTVCSTGPDGSFGIITKVLYDSISVSLEGYETQVLRVKTDAWQNIVLKPAPDIVYKNRPRLISFTSDKDQGGRFNPFLNDETYFKLVENEFVKASEYPTTGFSLNVNKASYSNVRRFINMQSKVPPDAVRIEELINYFNLGYQPPVNDAVFNINSTVTACPWNAKDRLLFVNVSAKKLDIENKPPGNFVFLIDVSGSMDMPNRLPLLKAAFQLFIKNLRAVDKISIVTYGGTVGVWLAPTPGNEQEKISRSIEVLTAAGDTPGSYAIEAAYKLAAANFIPGGNNRVILATDGDFNVGQTSEKQLDELITRQRKTGIYLTCLGVGMGNFKDSKLQTLAKRGNGNYAYLDDLHEAEKVLVYELTETLYAVADNAYINIDFYPTGVSAYRLIGFDNKKEALRDKNSDLDGGEIGSGSTTLAVFEILPAAGYAGKIDSAAVPDIGTLHLRYYLAGDTMNDLHQILYTIPGKPNDRDSAAKCAKFAAAVALYGMKLKESPYLNKATWTDVKTIAEAGADRTNYLQNDFLLLLDKTIRIYEPGRKNKKNKRNKKKDKETEATGTPRYP